MRRPSPPSLPPTAEGLLEDLGYGTVWSRVLLVEGTIGIGKSTLLERLLRRHLSQGKPRTVLHLTQAHTYGPLAPGEDDGTLTREQNVSHLSEVTGIVEWHVRALRSETRPKFYGLIDTLHLTHCVRPGAVCWEDVEAIDRRLAASGVRLLVMHARPETLWERGVLGRRGTGFLEYARKFGPTDEEIHAYFLREQEHLLRLAERSSMRREILDVEGGKLEDAAWALWMGG